tara:strand:+ start:590 stop:1561 length:972 start_codon:yes stop_codon:yes gene_type:complete
MTEKFTASQWAEIEGGHVMTPSTDYNDLMDESQVSQPYSFIKDISEARLTRTDGGVKTLTYTDCKERMYLTILMLEVLRQYPTYARTAANYARMTKGQYNYFDAKKSDLHNFIYFLVGDSNAQNKLKDPDAAKRLRESTKINLSLLNAYLTSVSNNTLPNRVSELLIKLESDLSITNTDYKAVRRILTQFSSASLGNKQKVVTRLLIAARAKLRTSDLIDDFSKLAADKNLETSAVVDNEPTVSTPDLGMSAKDASLYRYLVGTQNLAQARQFLALASQGRSIPSTYVQAYLPAIKMIDDIVQAGPTYVQHLRNLQQRAKKSR